MAIALRPSSGVQVYASATAPATFDEPGYEALTFTEVKGFNQLGAVGNMHEVGNFDSLTEGRIKFRSITDPGQIDATPADLPADAGQIILKAAFDAAKGSASEKVSIKIEDEAGYGVYAQCIVSSWQRQYGGAADVQMRNAVLPIIAGTIVEFEPA